jgi:hypothetical protein
MRHLHENFHKKFKHPELGILLWKAADADNEDIYLDIIKKMRDINEKAVDWLLKEAKPEFWVKCYFEGNRYGHLTSNIAESFNSKILTAREQPILAMLETIRQQLMDWFTARRLMETNTPGILVSTILNQLNELIKRARKYPRARESIPGILYEITSNETGRKYLVNLNLRTCSCRAWQSTGYPCSHALSVILTHQLPIHDYTESFFTLDAFRKTYSNAIIPPNVSDLAALTGPLPPPEPANYVNESSDEEIDEEEDEEEDDILPPTIRRQPGRPRKERTDAEKERRRLKRGSVRRIQKCILCRAVGHSRRTCKGPPN